MGTPLDQLTREELIEAVNHLGGELRAALTGKREERDFWLDAARAGRKQIEAQAMQMRMLHQPELVEARRASEMLTPVQVGSPVPNERWYRALKVLAMLTGVAGSAATATGSHFVFAGFALFLFSSVIWIGVAWRQREISLLLLQLSFAAIDAVGMWRWG